MTGGDRPSTDTQRRLDELRRALLHLHKALVESERAAYERVQGRVTSSFELLQLVIHDPWFVWLHPLSELVVRIDELLDAEEPPTTEDLGAIAEQVRALLRPKEERPDAAVSAFGSNYYVAFQRDPGVVLAHAGVSRVLSGEGQG